MAPKANEPGIPGRLKKLKKWLTVPEAADYLAVVLGEAVTEADVLRLGLDGHLKLSVRFVNLAQAKRYVDPAPGFAEAYEEFTAAKAARAAGLPDPVGEERASTLSDEECDRVVVLRDELYDLPLVGGERLNVEQEYQRQIGGAEVVLSAFDGAFVDSEDSIRFQLYKEDLTTGASHVKPGELPYYLEASVEPYRSRTTPASFDPLRRLPSDSVLVVRMTALHLFEAKALERTESSVESIEKPLGERERRTLLIIIDALAKEAGVDLSRPTKAGETIANLIEKRGHEVAPNTVSGHIRTVNKKLRGVPDGSS